MSRSQLPAAMPEIGKVAVRVGSRIGRHSFDRAKQVAHALGGSLIQNAVGQFDIRDERGADHVGARPLASTSAAVQLTQQARGQTNRHLSLHEANVTRVGHVCIPFVYSLPPAYKWWPLVRW